MLKTNKMNTRKRVSSTKVYDYRYAFNGMEKDDQVKGKGNSYDFGARMLDTRLGRWLTIDPLAMKFPNLSPYNFVLNTPIWAVDPDGRDIIFVNGYYNTGNGDMPGCIADGLVGNKGGRAYWREQFINKAKSYLKDNTVQFIDGSGAWNSSGKERYDAGYKFAQDNFGKITSNILDADGVQIETLKVVSHSMGAAYSEGMIKYLEEKGIKVEKVIHFSPADPSDFQASTNPKTIQLDYINDPVLFFKNFDDISSSSTNKIQGVDINATVDGPGGHYAGKQSPGAFDNVEDAEKIKFSYNHNIEMKEYLDKGMVYKYNIKVYNTSGTQNNTKFSKIGFSNGKTFEGGSKGSYTSSPKI